MADSYIGVINGKCTSFVGPDAVNYVRAELLASALKLYGQHGIMPTRGVTGPKMLKMATGYTGITYRRGQYELAAMGVKQWADEMKAALPKI